MTDEEAIEGIVRAFDEHPDWEILQWSSAFGQHVSAVREYFTTHPGYRVRDEWDSLYIWKESE